MLQRRSDSRSTAKRFMLTPASKASIARARWVSGGMRTVMAPRYQRVDSGSGIGAPSSSNAFTA